MAQWVNRLSRNNIFVNLPPLPLSCEISGALHLAQPGLTAGWLAGRRNTEGSDTIPNHVDGSRNQQESWNHRNFQESNLNKSRIIIPFFSKIP